MTDLAADRSRGAGPSSSRHSVSGPWVVLGAAAMVLAAVSVFVVAALGQPDRVQVGATAGIPQSPAAPLLAPITLPGAPPADVLSGLVVPKGSKAGTFLNQDTPEGQYDRSASLTVGYPADQVLSFYTNRLKALGWRVASVTVARGGKGNQVVAERLARDGFTWDAGVTVLPLAGDGSRVTLRLFQRSEI